MEGPISEIESFDALAVTQNPPSLTRAEVKNTALDVVMNRQEINFASSSHVGMRDSQILRRVPRAMVAMFGTRTHPNHAAGVTEVEIQYDVRLRQNILYANMIADIAIVAEAIYLFDSHSPSARDGPVIVSYLDEPKAFNEGDAMRYSLRIACD
jgi:hypothetical protein